MVVGQFDVSGGRGDAIATLDDKVSAFAVLTAVTRPIAAWANMHVPGFMYVNGAIHETDIVATCAAACGLLLGVPEMHDGRYD
jgi:hypothetical protein